MKGMFSKIFSWGGDHIQASEASPVEWLAGLALILLFAVLWTRVVKQVIEGPKKIIESAV